MPLTEIQGFGPNAHLFAGQYGLVFTQDGMDFNDDTAVTEAIDFIELAEQGFGPYSLGSIQGVGIEAAAYGGTYTLILEVSNDKQNWYERGSATGTGGQIVNDIDLSGGFRFGHVTVKVEEGATCTGTVFFCATRERTS